MVFKNNIPQPTDNLSDSQADLLGNMQQLDTSFGIDHYTFSNLTANNGFHNTVTTPIITGSAHPTITTNPKLYGMQDSANVGTIQYSRGPDIGGNAMPPTPITKVHSPSAGINISAAGTSNVLDFTGITRAIATIYIGCNDSSFVPAIYQIFWTGSLFRLNNNISNSLLVIQNSGSVLQIKNNGGVAANNVFWTLELHRLQ